jgi:chorismate synthase
MSSSFGEIFRITTWGESHGPALGVVIEGVPAGLPITVEEVQTELDRRRVGQSKVTTPRGEMDKATILSGVYEGITTGAPVSLITYNADADSSKYDNLRDVFRPGHADYTYWAKYGHRDHRGGGRSSARETWGRVAAGAIAKKILGTVGTEVWGFTKSVNDVEGETVDRAEVEKNLVRAADPVAAEKMIALIMQAKEDKDSLGGVIEVRAEGVPVGLGEPTFDKIEALIAHAMMSIPATKGVEIGRGFATARMKGSESNDSLSIVGGRVRALSNNAGGTLGGISTGEDIIVRVVVKPTSSIEQEQDTVGTDLKPAKITVYGRHDPSVVTRAVPVIEAMLAITLADLLLRNRAARI